MERKDLIIVWLLIALAGAVTVLAQICGASLYVGASPRVGGGGHVPPAGTLVLQCIGSVALLSRKVWGVWVYAFLALAIGIPAVLFSLLGEGVSIFQWLLGGITLILTLFWLAKSEW